jgi:cellulose biosynthesis protein BcsQ
MNKIITFYSYKGGVGRTMCLANAGTLLAQWGYKVLMIDWDLEAPGLEFYFKDYTDVKTIRDNAGIMEILEAKPEPYDLNSFVTLIDIGKNAQPLSLITAGKRDSGYFKSVQDFDIDEYYAKGGGEYIEKLRNSWLETYDFVLIDSRTGVTETNGIGTIQLPDIVVLLFSANEQGFVGTLDISNRILEAQQKLLYERQKLVFLPVIAKFDTQTEFKLADEWLNYFSAKLDSVYKYWLPRRVSIKDFLVSTKIPYITYFSFGEKLPVIEQGVTDPAGAGFAYENITALLANDLNKADVFLSNRDAYIQSARSNTSTAKQVFISYSAEDSALKDAIANYIKRSATGIAIVDDNDLSAGRNWANDITDFITSSDGIILLLSDGYYSSNKLMNEFFILQNLIAASPKPISQIRLKKMLPEEYETLDTKELEIIEAEHNDEKSYVIVSDELKSFLNQYRS